MYEDFNFYYSVIRDNIDSHDNSRWNFVTPLGQFARNRNMVLIRDVPTEDEFVDWVFKRGHLRYDINDDGVISAMINPAEHRAAAAQLQARQQQVGN